MTKTKTKTLSLSDVESSRSAVLVNEAMPVGGNIDEDLDLTSE